jgi:hypothetical protein
VTIPCWRLTFFGCTHTGMQSRNLCSARRPKLNGHFERPLLELLSLALPARSCGLVPSIPLTLDGALYGGTEQIKVSQFTFGVPPAEADRNRRCSTISLIRCSLGILRFEKESILTSLRDSGWLISIHYELPHPSRSKEVVSGSRVRPAACPQPHNGLTRTRCYESTFSSSPSSPSPTACNTMTR